MNSTISRQYWDDFKDIARYLDSHFKKTGHDSIKFHHVWAAVIQAAATENYDNDSFNRLLQYMNNQITEAGNDEIKINASVFGGKELFEHLDDVFPTQYVDCPIHEFKLTARIASSMKFEKPLYEIEDGEPVNITGTLNQNDADIMTQELNNIITQLGFDVGRLTSTSNTTERHVSFALRVPFTKEFIDIVDDFNKENLDKVYETIGKLRVVIPPDIRTVCSIISLVDNDMPIFKDIQSKISTLAVGNRLPGFHITQGNIPTNIPEKFPEKYVMLKPKISEYLGKFGFIL